MKKSTATITLAAVAGFTALTASPAVAAPFVFDDCTQAKQYGVFNIPAGSPGYGAHLDQPFNGIGCEREGAVYDPTLVPAGDVTITPTPPTTPVAPVDQVAPNTPTTPVPSMNQVTPVMPVAPVSQVPQVAQMPVGGAATGVAQETTDNSGVMALGAGLVLVAVAGGAFAVRRRAVQA